MLHRPAPFPPNESARLDALSRLEILDTLPETVFDDIVTLATSICETPIGLVSLIDAERQWFKACIGLDVRETHRDQAFCAHAILAPDELLIVEDATRDSRFSANPLVLGAPHIRFYAGAPILTPAGFALGTVCVIDTVPRTLDASQRNALEALARQTGALLELRELGSLKERQTRELSKKIIQALADDSGEHAALRQNQRVATVGQLTSGVAHDFNNLLQALSTSLELINRWTASVDDVQRWSSNGLQVVRRGASLVAQLLAFSRGESLKAEPLPVCAWLGQMKELLPRVLGPEVELEFDLKDDDVKVSCNGTQLEAAVMNMVVNARDAMHNVGRIRISTSRAAVVDDGELPDGNYFVLQVSDNGPGMTSDVAQRAFEPFFTTKDNGKGTGLGLSQVMGFARELGGAARVETALGVGTCVSLYLKALSGQAGNLPVHAPGQESRAVSAGTEILLVDDDADVRDTWQALLSAVGYRVNAVASGFAAVYAFEHSAPRLVITDCAMPGLGGPGLARVLHELRPGLPIIFVTGHSDLDALRCQLEPDATLLRKPVALDVLIASIESLLAHADPS
ncbi:ATP-binding protein [Paraburkholderia sp.]|uniref:GAF domain-containing hybrid sensor histidine kinase/response regulator n=1 Tax=Paraburkholderia sp. TaxID=1926495 RepID=UPI002397F9E6|nr:ATP-binding protein [Paraburkholderia sp.]MDE1180198.1 response regulator [Paraburkholderia sp.]